MGRDALGLPHGRPVLPGFRRIGLAMLLGAACAHDRSVSFELEAPAVEAYMPLALGHAWTYAVRFPGQSGERTVRIVELDEQGFFVDDAGGAFKITPSGLRDRRRYLLRTPLEVGVEWQAVLSVGAVEHYRIASVGEACEVRAGRFKDCVVVESSLRRDARMTLLVEFTWARGVGLVRVATTAQISGRGNVPQTEQSLLSYEFGSKPDIPEAGEATTEEAPRADTEDPPETWGR